MVPIMPRFPSSTLPSSLMQANEQLTVNFRRNSQCFSEKRGKNRAWGGDGEESDCLEQEFRRKGGVGRGENNVNGREEGRGGKLG